MSTMNKISKEIYELISVSVKKGQHHQKIFSDVKTIATTQSIQLSDAEIDYYICQAVEDFKGYEFVKAVNNGAAIILSPNNTKNLYLYNSILKTKKVVNERDLNNLCLKTWKNKILPVEAIYNPHSSDDITPADIGTGIAKFNLYQPPKWKVDAIDKAGQIESRALPDIYDKFLKHLFDGDEQSIKFVLNWMSLMLKAKNFTYLVTLGKEGAGKGILGDIMQMLVGKSNYVHMAFKSISKQFNSQLMNKQVIYFDEVMVSKQEQEDLLKMLVNDEIEIEQKNIDAKNLKNYASIYLSSNNLNALKISPSDRRFSITELTEKSFKDVFSIEFRSELLEEDNISVFGEYLLSLDVNLNEMRTPFISSRTLKAKQSSLKEWEDEFLSNIAYAYEGKSVPLHEINIILQENLNNNKLRISFKSLAQLEKAFPGFYKIRRELINKRKIYVVTFKPLNEQPVHLLENIELTDADSEVL